MADTYAQKLAHFIHCIHRASQCHTSHKLALSAVTQMGTQRGRHRKIIQHPCVQHIHRLVDPNEIMSMQHDATARPLPPMQSLSHLATAYAGSPCRPAPAHRALALCRLAAQQAKLIPQVARHLHLRWRAISAKRATGHTSNAGLTSAALFMHAEPLQMQGA